MRHNYLTNYFIFQFADYEFWEDFNWTDLDPGKNYYFSKKIDLKLKNSSFCKTIGRYRDLLSKAHESMVPRRGPGLYNTGNATKPG